MPNSIWFTQIPTPVRTVNVSDLAGLQAARADLANGDRIKCADGVYNALAELDFSGKSDVQIISEGYRAQLIGALKMGPNSWVIGMDVSMPTVSVGAGSLITASSDNCHIINCYIHDAPNPVTTNSMNGFISGGGKSGGLFYGNFVMRARHILYIQNALPNPKYFVHNYFGDVKVDATGNGFIIHAYTHQANNLTNMKFYQNVLPNGSHRLGGETDATPPVGCEFVGNIFYKGGFASYKRADDSIWQNNIMHGPDATSIHWDMIIYGAGDARTHNAKVFTNNVVRGGIKVKTDSDGSKPLDPADNWDNTKYYDAVFNTIWANGSSLFGHSLSQWQTRTLAAGHELDTNGTITALPITPDGYQLFCNSYDDARALLVVQNWSGNGVLLPGAAFTGKSIYAATDPYGAVKYVGGQTVTEPEVSAWLVR